MAIQRGKKSQSRPSSMKSPPGGGGKRPNGSQRASSHRPGTSRQGGGSSGGGKQRHGQQSAGLVSRTTDGVKGAGSKVMDSVKQHPVTAGVIGTGLAAGITYLAVRAIRGSSSTQGEQEDARSDRESTEPEMEGEGEGQVEGEEGESDEQEEGGEEEDDEEDVGLAGRARSAMGSLAGRMNQAMRGGASGIGQRVEEGRQKLGSFWQDHPLLAGTGVFALGITAGLLIPSSRAETGLLGKKSGKLTDRVKSAGREILEQGKEVAEKVVTESADVLRQEIDREGLTPQKITRKVKRIAGRLKDVVADATGMD